MPKPVLRIVIASTRPGRHGPLFADWFEQRARAFGGFELAVTDLATLALPFLDEPHHPRLANYTQQHTKDWSALVAGSDAFVVVMPEYNHGYNAVIKNALDFLHNEWANKAVGFLSYGGVSAGTRAVQQLKQVVVGLRMMPVVEAVAVPMFFQMIKDGVFTPPPPVDAAADAMLAELLRVTELIRPTRATLPVDGLQIPIG